MAGTVKYDKEFLKRQYVTTNMSLREMGDEYGISLSYVSRLSANHQWAAAREEFQKRAAEAEQEAKIKGIKDEVKELRDLTPMAAGEHQQRVLQAGDHLGALIERGIVASRAGDWKTLKQATETWKGWDDQMRKNHGIDSAVEKPLVNISVLGALPSREEMERRRAAKQSGESESAESAATVDVETVAS